MSSLKKVGRVTAAGRTDIPQIDGLKFPAILTVITIHLLSTRLYRFAMTTATWPAAAGDWLPWKIRRPLK